MILIKYKTGKKLWKIYNFDIQPLLKFYGEVQTKPCAR